MRSSIRYVRNQGGHVAYQVTGAGPLDIAFLPGAWGQLELRWEQPAYARLLHRLGESARVIQFDRRGTGLSDRTAVAPAIHDHVSDLVAVLGAVGARRPVLFGTFDGAAAAVEFAVTRPGHATSLILYASFAKAIHDDPACPGIAISEELMLGSTDERWGDPWLLDIAAPSKTTDPAFVEWWSRYQRASAGPAAARALISGVAAIDVRDLLPKVQAPTLVLHREGDRLVPIANGRFVADAIPGAQFVALPGDDYVLYAGDVDAVASAIEVFLGARTKRPAQAPAAEGLTAREREIASFVERGLTNKQIASRLVLSERTVESHVSSVLRKLGMSSRAQIATWSARNT